MTEKEQEKEQEARPLNDIMMAMDVVDTLRHQELLVERELNTEDRDRMMLERLRKIYASQGIEVPEHVLEQGVSALKEGRFVYKPPKKGVKTWFAGLYINRKKWGKPLLIGVAALALGWLAYTMFISIPTERRIAALPQQLEVNFEKLIEQAKGPLAVKQAQTLLAEGKSALEKDDTDSAQTALKQMKALQAAIALEYELRIVSRPGERSGVWRIPSTNPNARNYYIIVEAVTADGQALEVPVVNEEDGKIHLVKKWGLRVDQNVFERIAADKKDDGIIQNNEFGIKRRGYLKPEYLMPTTGRAITSW